MGKKIKKIIPYLLILLIVVELFSPAMSARAQSTEPTDNCVVGENSVTPNTTERYCTETLNGTWMGKKSTPTPAPTPTPGTPKTPYELCIEGGSTPKECSDGGLVGAPTKPTAPGKEDIASSTALGNKLDSCGLIISGSLAGCFEWITYFIFVVIPSAILAVVAIFFNFAAALTLSSTMYTAGFIQQIWGVVRDFANIFFILVLLYAAFQTILGLGHGGARKIIASVIVVALVVNFSLFFTKVVIDSSNILALIFYNKITVSGGDYTPMVTPGDGKVVDKDIAGALVSAFNINTFFNSDNLAKIAGSSKQFGIDNALSAYVLVSMMVIYGIIIGVLIYAFFIAGFSLFSRMITLMMLLIVSPFAFVSYAVPKLKGINTIGFDSWVSKLLETSFVAAIFMFIVYLTSVILKEGSVFATARDGTYTGMLQTLIMLFMPAALICILLVKGASYAKKASGEFTGAVMSLGKAAAGLAIGGAALGVAGVGRATVGAVMKGASTGDTSARRLAAGDPTLGRFGRITGRLQQVTGIDALQQRIGTKLNANQHIVEHAAHARHDLDTAAGNVAHGKKWNELNGEQRELVRRNIARSDEMRALGYGNKTWTQITNEERERVTNNIAPKLASHTTAADTLINDARKKQGILSSAVQSTVTGSYDVRNLANLIAREQTTGFTKLTTGITGAIAKSMRGGLKTAGINYGTPQRAFFKDLGNTISEALKSAKINVDLSSLGAEHKESHGGGGGHDAGHSGGGHGGGGGHH